MQQESRVFDINPKEMKREEYGYLVYIVVFSLLL